MVRLLAMFNVLTDTLCRPARVEVDKVLLLPSSGRRPTRWILQTWHEFVDVIRRLPAFVKSL